MLAPCSVGTRRLMIDANPIFFSSGTASAVVAPPQATVVSSRAKLVTPGTSCLVTCWAIAGATAISAIAIERDARMRVAPLRAHHATKRADRATGRACAARRGGYRRKMADPACCGKGDHTVAADTRADRSQRE